MRERPDSAVDGGRAPLYDRDFDSLVERARVLADSGQRRILGIAGAPASGKGRLANRIKSTLGSSAVVVPMDGFHLAQVQLRRLGKLDRKGAPDTFDAAGYVALLRRIREHNDETVYAPKFHRKIEESYASAIAVPPDVTLVITEGNYLLLDREPWSQVRELLDQAWFLASADALRVERLITRHMRHGMTTEQARDWVYRSDERNSALIAPTRERADIIVEDLE